MIKPTLAACLLTAALAAAAMPALADQDDVRFGSDIRVAPNAEAQDVVCFFCSVDVEGTVNGDVVVFFGDIHIAGHANHDVVNFFGSVSADNNTSIGEDLVNFFGSIRLGDNVSVGQDMVEMFGSVSESDSVTIGKDRVVEPGFVLWIPLIVIGVIVWAVHREFSARRYRIFMANRGYPPYMG
jgi:hypothetical protein